MIFGELFMKHGAEDAVRAGDLLLQRAAEEIVLDLRRSGSAASCRSCLILWPISSLIPNIAAALLALFGLWMYEHLWIKAGQAVPLS